MHRTPSKYIRVTRYKYHKNKQYQQYASINKFWDTAHRIKNGNYALLMVPRGRRWRINNGGRKALHKGRQGIQVSKRASKNYGTC